LLEARAALVEVLSSQGDERSGVLQATDRLSDTLNIQGVGIGYAKPSDGLPPGQPTLTVYLAEPRHTDDVESVLVERMRVGAAASPSVPVVPVVTGRIEPIIPGQQAYYLRPAPGGISVINDNMANTVGTLGCLATGRTPPRDERLLILSCNHVLANSNLGAAGDCVVQPSTGDGGICDDTYKVAELERFVPVVVGCPTNYVDCATAWATTDQLSPQMLFNTPTGPTTFPITSSWTVPSLGMSVGKSGRTTGLTLGTVKQVYAAHWLGWGPGQKAWFDHQIVIESDTDLFAAGGDSGSLIWTWFPPQQPIGLLNSAGGVNPFLAFANPINYVLGALDINIIDTL
jgi:hypothetical protein